MATFDVGMRLGEARALFFARSGFAPDGGYGDRWVRVQLGPLPVWFPNTPGRRKAVKFHDLHHVLTEYPTSFRGETEIGAWEVSTGIGRHYAGWLLDLLAFAIGLVINPSGVYRAFVRGRRSANLFGTEWDERVLSESVGDVRRRLGLDAAGGGATRREKVAFALWATASVLTYLLAAAVILLPFLACSLWLLRVGGWI